MVVVGAMMHISSGSRLKLIAGMRKARPLTLLSLGSHKDVLRYVFTAIAQLDCNNEFFEASKR